MSSTSKKVLRFLVSGSLATLTNLTLLFIFTQWLEIWYLLSSVLAFITGLLISFGLQKWWTFKDYSTTTWSRQALWFVLVTIGGVLVNAIFIYLLVEYLFWYYLLAQLISGLLIATANFFLYRSIFRNLNSDESQFFQRESSHLE